MMGSSSSGGAAEEPSSGVGRSSSMEHEVVLGRSESQRRTAAASKSGGRLGMIKSGRSTGNDLLVCFAPRATLNLVSANRSLLSPSRDKAAAEPGSGRRAAARSASLFSSSNSNSSSTTTANPSSSSTTKKQSRSFSHDHSAELEPASPKVTCIGQVRSKSKNRKNAKAAFSRGSRRRDQQLPAEQHEPSARNSRACPGFGKDFSCFGLPCDSYGSLPSFRSSADKKSSGTLLAKSLVLLQQQQQRQSGSAAEQPSCSKLSLATAAPSSPVLTRMDSRRRENAEVLTSIEDIPPAEPTACVAEEPLSLPCRKLDAANKCSPEIEDDLCERASDLGTAQEEETEAAEEAEDAFEAEVPPPNALLLMRRKEHVVPPPYVDISLRRSTSAPIQQRRLARLSEEEEDEEDDGDPDLEQKAGLRENHRSSRDALMNSAADLPKSATVAAKAFLQRCRSVSQSLMRSTPNQYTRNSEDAEAAASSAGQHGNNEAAARPSAGGAASELYLLREAASRRRKSDSEALKVSLDVVPETWLWETWTQAHRQRTSELSQLPLASHYSEPSFCNVAGATGAESEEAQPQLQPVAAAAAQDAIGAADQCLDTGVEASLRRSCCLVASQVSTSPWIRQDDLAAPANPVDMVKVEQDGADSGEERTVKGRTSSAATAPMQRSSSVREHSRDGMRSDCILLRRSASVGQQVETRRGDMDDGSKPLQQQKLTERCTVVADAYDAVSLLTHSVVPTMKEEDPGRISSSSRSSATDDDVEAASGKGSSSSCPSCSPATETTEEDRRQYEQQEGGRSGEEDEEERGVLLVAAPSPSSVLDHETRRVPPPSPVPPTSTPDVLFVSYGRIRITQGEVKFGEEEEEQERKAAVLRALSHLHIPGATSSAYTRLLKAASSKEPASLSSAALRLQRCKSEPPASRGGASVYY